MPNHCENRVIFFADNEARLKEVAEKLNGVEPGYFEEALGRRGEGQTSKFSFHALIPVPDEVLDKKYADAGYDWQREHWGVKWGAYDIYPEVIQETPDGFSLSYSFYTAWRDPSGIIRILPEIFPDVDFDWSYSETGMMFFGAHRYRTESPEIIEEFYYDTQIHEDIYEIREMMKADEAPEDLIESVEALIEWIEEDEANEY